MNLPAHRIDILVDTAALATRMDSLAQEIRRTLPQDLVVVALLRGSFVFTADLIRAFYAHGIRPQIDFMTLESYGNATESSGRITLVRDITEQVAGRDVLIVDDILESGRTLNYAKRTITERGAHSVHSAVMLEKPGKRAVNIQADFVGFAIPDVFVVGMGLDYANRYRELPYVGAVILERN